MSQQHNGTISGPNIARTEMLRRIRSALADVPRDETPDTVAIERDYTQSEPVERDELVRRFVERVTEYKAQVRSVREESLAPSIAAACAAHSVKHLAVPPDIPAAWLTELASGGVELLRDDAGNASLSYAQLDSSDGVLTGCALAIAQTGTIVLDAGAYQGRRVLTLLPDYHLCIVYEDQIVGMVPQAIERLADAVREQRHPITFISGPSATSDIELSRVEGVHGPRTLEVLVVTRRADP
ncbi:MAG TPA: LUD domain-containing protein [Ktedonobacterales bacterium]